jgi:hypothetical protein
MAALNLDLLKAFNQYLFSVVVNATGHTSGTHDVDISTLPVSPEHQMKLAEFSMIPRIPPPQTDMAQLEQEERAAMEMAADEAAAKNRLNEYAAAGLEGSDYNFNLIRDYVIGRASGYWSSESVDESIRSLKTTLKWKTKTAAPEPAVEVLKPLPNGESRLPLEIDNVTLRRSSKAQVQDWLSRQRTESPYARSSGSFGSKF